MYHPLLVSRWYFICCVDQLSIRTLINSSRMRSSRIIENVSIANLESSVDDVGAKQR